MSESKIHHKTIRMPKSKLAFADSQQPVIQDIDNSELRHACTLESLPINDLLSKHPTWMRNIIVCETNPRTKQYFSSLYQIQQEVDRHINGPTWFIIHPLSKFVIYWELIMFCVYIINWYVILFQIANHSDLTSISETINFVIQFPCIIDLILRFFIGYISQYDIILNHCDIVRHYLKTWFFTDLITSIPFQFMGRLFGNQLDERWYHIMILYQGLKILTISRIRRYLENTWTVWKLHHLTYMIFALTLISLLIFHLEAMIYQICANFGAILNQHDINDLSNVIPDPSLNKFWFKYLFCLYLGALKFYTYCFSSAHGLYSKRSSLKLMEEILTLGVAYVYHLYACVKVIQIFQFLNHSAIKYQEIMNQLEQYMRAKRLPLPIKEALIEFYEQRYHYQFFKEKSIHKNLSESLQRELIFHCGRMFIKRIPIFDNVPTQLISNIVACLKPETYRPNDLIIKAGTIGDCMYFIAAGTVSIRTTTGQELLHLEDGDHFGEISLFSKYGKRVSNIVALEYCELYRLDKSDYETNIAVIPELRAKFEVLAMERMHATSTVEEQYKTKRNRKYKAEESRASPSYHSTISDIPHLPDVTK